MDDHPGMEMREEARSHGFIPCDAWETRSDVMEGSVPSPLSRPPVVDKGEDSVARQRPQSVMTRRWGFTIALYMPRRKRTVLVLACLVHLLRCWESASMDGRESCLREVSVDYSVYRRHNVACNTL